MKRVYWIAGIIGLLIIIGIVFASIKNIGKPEGQMVFSPYIDFEATVVSVSLDESGNYLEGDEIVSAPSDSAIVRIDKIITSGGSSNFDWASIGIKEDSEVLLDFSYTVRPTKIITVVGETTQSGDIVSHTIVPTKISFENNYFIFKENGNSETETILSGLQEGSKFKTRLWKTFEVKVGKYEIIS